MFSSKIHNVANSKAGKHLIFILSFIATFFIYCQASTIWIHYGGTSSHLFFMEIPFLLFISYFFYFQIHTSVTRNVIAAFLAITPILGLYVWIDIFYTYLHRLPNFSDTKSISLLASVSPRLFSTTIVCGLLVLLPLVVYSLKSLKTIEIKKRRHLYWSGVGRRVILLFIFMAFSLSGSLSSYQQQRYEVTPMDIYGGTVRSNGRVMSVLHRERKSEEIRNKLAHYTPHLKNHMPIEISENRNVHIVVLESLMDVRFIQGITFNKSPLYEKMPSILNGDQFSIGISPVYGGSTAQAEFEILSGVPAFAKIEMIEFNVLGGRPIHSFISALKQNGYTSIASIATKKKTANGNFAYKSLGFDELFSTEEGPTPYKNPDSVVRFIPDSDFLKQNLEYIHKHHIGKEKPFVNYVLGLYGHLPFQRDKNLYPDVIKSSINGESCSTIDDISNLFYYRTKAIYDYVIGLRKIDPNAVVLLIADHLPAVLNKKVEYSLEDHHNVFLLLDGKERYEVKSEPHYYEIPYILGSILSEKTIVTPNQQDYEDIYFDIMATGYQH